MKFNFAKIIFVVVLFLMGFYSCGELISYSETPAIEYRDHIAKDSINLLGNVNRYVELKFSIIDGDGDFGLSVADTMPPFDSLYYFNFFTTLYGFSHGKFDSVAIENPNFRIKDVPIEEHKTYKADIYVEFDYPKSFLKFDTIKYDFYVVDKALHHSNTVTTPNIIFE
ncbi:MAG: hypothetical protein K9H64_13430 [Bacteroidales bacterium]|nr:hypothetical protein [Bacteroidales bacterium]MCF8456354.1 hypothetical protein [Bacteroidales bacterium]